MKKPIETVVLVDDSEVDNHIHTRVLRRSGLVERVMAFEMAEEALEFFRNDDVPVSLCLLDINMPRMDGFEFLEAYRKLPRADQAEVTVVMLTSSESRRDRERAQAFAEVVKFASKPLTQEMVEDLVQRHFSE